MDLKNIDHINLTVTNFDKTVDWYRRVFGFQLVEEDLQEGIRWGVVRNGEVMLCIYEHPECRHEDRFAMRAKSLHGINHFGLRITDQAAWEATIQQESLNILYNGAIQWAHSTSWYVADPTGWEIEVSLWKNDDICFDSEI